MLYASCHCRFSQNTWVSPSLSNSHVPMYGPMHHNFMYGAMPPQMSLPYMCPPIANYSPYTRQSSTSSPVISPYPFTLKVLSSRIQICQACRIPFHSSITEAPYDLVVARKECRPYKGQGGESKTPSTPSNSHNHVHCLKVLSLLIC